MKYQYCIWFECVANGINWYVSMRGNKNPMSARASGFSSSYDEAVAASEAQFRRIEPVA